MSDSMLGRGADAAFATQKPCKHGTVLADLCGLCNTATPDALLRLRYILRREEGESRSARDRTRVFVAAAVTYIELREVIAALEAERRENAKRLAWILKADLGEDEFHCSVSRARNNLREALALLDGGAE